MLVNYINTLVSSALASNMLHPQASKEQTEEKDLRGREEFEELKFQFPYFIHYLHGFEKQV